MYKLIKNFRTNEVNTVNKYDGDMLLSIPFNPANTDYQEYLEWLDEGNEPEEAD